MSTYYKITVSKVGSFYNCLSQFLQESYVFISNFILNEWNFLLTPFYFTPSAFAY